MNFLDQVYSRYRKQINMTRAELKRWKQNPLSKECSRQMIKINMELTQLPKHKWNLRHIKNALKVLATIKRTKQRKSGKKVDGKLSKKTILMMNCGYNPNK